MALTRMLQRRGTATQWADVANSVILAPGEIGLVVLDPTATVQSTDVGKFKIGDGVKTWTQLSYRFDDAQNQSKYSRLVATQTFEGSQVVTPSTASTIPLVVAGKTSQSAHLQEWRDVSGNILGYVGPDGLLSTKGATFNANVEMNNHSVSGLKDIDGSATDSYAVNKKYVDQAIAGLKWREPVNLVATSNVALSGSSGSLAIDGHPGLTAEHGNGYRILLAAQTTKSEDGIYDYADAGSGYTLTRSSDSDTYEELIGSTVFVLEGTTYGTSSWVQSNHYITDFGNATTPPSHWQTWVQFNGANQITAGTGMAKSGNVLNVGAESGGGLQVNADTVQIASGGVTSDMIANGTIVNDDINADAEIAPSKIAGTAVTQDDTGTVTSTMIANDTILDIDIHSNAAINKNKIAGVAVTQADTQTVTSAMIVNDTIVNTDISVSAEIAQAKIANLVDDLADRSLTTHTHTINELSDVTITNDLVLGTPKDRQVIKYKGAPVNAWVNELPSGGISIGSIPPVDAAPGDAWFDSTDGSLYVYYDDSTGSPARTNLIANPSFETNLDGWNHSGVATVTRTTSQSYSGTASASIDYVASQPRFYYQKINVTPFQAYTASAYVKQMSATSDFNMAIEWADSGGTILSESQGSLATANTSGWTRASITIDAPAGAATAKVSVYNQSDYYLDAVMLEQSATLGAYIDTTSPAGSSSQWVQVKANSALEGSILTRLSAVESRDTKLEAANAVRVADQAERDATYPSPVQGNTVFRADLGYEQKYYAAYNATTNPDGTTGTIGWYEYRGGAPLSENKVINGALDHWQRGAGSFAGNTWNADRFYTFNYSGTSGTTQVTLPYSDAATIGTDGVYMLRLTPGTVGDMGLMTKIEDVRTFAGDTVTISFWAKTTSGSTTFQYVNLSQEFGTGGSTSVYSGVQMQSSTVDTNWKRFIGTVSLASISGKTLGAGNHLMFRIDLNETFTGAGIDFTGFQVELGPVATAFRRNQPNIQAELAACQRYYFRVTDSFISNARSSIDLYNQLYRYPVTMRSSPVLDAGGTYRASAGNNGTVAPGASQGESGVNGLYLYNSSNNWTSNAEIFVTFGVSAEL